MKLLSVLLAVLICFNAYAAETFEDGVKAYEEGNYTEAIKIFTPLANAGLAEAQHNIGVMYANGRGVVQDDAQALKWYRLAAEQGYALAQYNIGFMYKNGQGVVKNYISAHIWFNLAAANGYNDAVEVRDMAAKQLTSQQLITAQKRASECQANNYKNC